MNEKFNKNAKVEQLTKVVLSHGEEKGLIVKDPFSSICQSMYEKSVENGWTETWTDGRTESRTDGELDGRSVGRRPGRTSPYHNTSRLKTGV